MPIRFELSEQTREAVDSYIWTANKKPGEFLFANRQNPDRCITARQYAWLFVELGNRHGLDPSFLGRIL